METSRGFIESARRLNSTNQGIAPTPSDRRGAIVLAYYAVFHRLAELCAEELAGIRAENVKGSRAWNEYYRSLDHSTVRQSCKRAISEDIGISSAEVFYDWFPNLQDARELCNYEALVEPSFEDTKGIIQTAEECITCLNNIEETERKDFVAWMILTQKGGVKKRRDKNFKNDDRFFGKFSKKLDLSKG